MGRVAEAFDRGEVLGRGVALVPGVAVPVVLRVQSGAMSRAGVPFFVSANGVWLTERVGTEYIEEL